MHSALFALKTLVHPYYIINILLGTSFIVSKSFTPLCRYLFGGGSECELSLWESEIMIMVVIIVMFKSKKSGSRSLYTYINTFCLYAKAFSTFLWFRADPIMGLVYLILIIVHFLALGEPVEQIQSNILYFDANGLEEELKKDKDTYWLIAFFTSWSPQCTKLAPVFAKLSCQYALANMKFGKVDVGRYPDLAKKYHINVTPFSVQLPTIALYKGDELLMRRPSLDSNGKLMKFYFTHDNIIAAYDLNNIYQGCKEKLSNKSEHVKTE